MPRLFAAVAAAIVMAVTSAPAQAQTEAQEVRLSKGFGITYLPMYVMDHEKLFEKQAKAAGLGDIKVTWNLLDGAPQVNDAVLAGALDIAGNGMPAFITIWSRSKDVAGSQVVGIAGLSGMPLYLNTLNPDIKSLRDFSAKDKIAVTGVRTGLGAVVLQMAVAKEFGIENYNKLDPFTVGLLHPDAYQAIASGKTEINAHLASPPFGALELKLPGVRRIVNSVDVLGNIHLMAVFGPKKFLDANPKTTAAFLAALDEANALIAKDKPKAAQIYATASKVKVTPEDVLEIISDKDMKFATTPDGSMQIADFLHKIGTIKNRPADWKEMFVPAVQGRPGS